MDEPHLDVSVSKISLMRALCVLDAFVKRVEKIGGRVEVRKEHWRENTIVVFGGEDVTAIRLREKHKQVPAPPDERKSWGANIDLEPTGLLVLDGGPSCYDRYHLRDTPKRRRIEEGLNDLIIGFVKTADHIRIKRRLAAEAQQRHEEQERIRRQQEEELRRKREELQRLQDAEQARVDELINHANSWRQSRIVRIYLDAVRQMLIQRDGELSEEGETAEYLAWAEQQAKRLDPLAKSPLSVLDESI